MKILLFVPLLLQVAVIFGQDEEAKQNNDALEKEIEQKQREQAEQQRLELQKELLRKQQQINENYKDGLNTTDKAQTSKDAPIDVPINLGGDPDDPLDPASWCDDFFDQVSCESNILCYWNPNQWCSNKVSCPSVPLNQCAQTKFCKFIPATSGYCSGPPAHCKPYNFIQCHKDPLCAWQVQSVCSYKDPMPAFPNCGGMNVHQCLQNSQFCNLYGQCFDNKNFCQSLNYQQCIADPACNYTFTQKEQCLNNPKFCSNLGEKDCLKNSLYCNGVYTIPKCVNQFICDGLNYDQCKQSSKYCQNVLTPFSCSPKKNICSTFTNPSQCILAGCAPVLANGQFLCKYATPCETFNQDECKIHQQFCNYKQEFYTCKNTYDCASITDPYACKNNKSCQFIPSQFKCLSKQQNCPQLSGVACKKNPACTYIPAQGHCSQDMDFGCQNLSLLQCENNKHCQLKYSCTPKKVPNCNAITISECLKNLTFCKIVEKGQCLDKKFDCALSQDKCILTKPCVWHPSTISQCVNEVNCNGLPISACQQNNACNVNQNPHCSPI